jgi:hypothetical protein
LETDPVITTIAIIWYLAGLKFSSYAFLFFQRQIEWFL